MLELKDGTSRVHNPSTLQFGQIFLYRGETALKWLCLIMRNDFHSDWCCFERGDVVLLEHLPSVCSVLVLFPIILFKKLLLILWHEKKIADSS